MKVASPVLRSALALPTVATAVVVFVSTLYWLMRYTHPLPWWDQWDFIASYSTLRQNGGSWIDFFFRQHNEHRIAIPRLLFISDLELFGGRNTSLVFANIGIQLTTWIGLCTLAFVHVRHRKERLLAAAFAIILLFSSAQSENFVWGFQVQFVGVYAAAVWACVLASRNKVGGACILGVVATLTMANGVFVWPVLALLVLVKDEGRRPAALIYAAGFVVCFGVYLFGYASITAHTPLSYSLTHPVKFFVYLTAYLGGALGSGRPNLAVFFGTTELLAFLALSVTAWRRRRLQSEAFWALWSVGLFVLISGAVTAVGRLGFGVEQALAGRYVTPASIFLVCAFFAQASMARTRDAQGSQGPLTAVAFVALGLLVVGMACYNHARGRGEMAGRHHALQVAAAAVASGSGDLKIYGGVHATPEAVEHNAIWLKNRRLSIFSERPWSLVGATLGVDVAIAPRGRCIGWVDDAKSVEGAPASAAISGWAWDTLNNRRPGVVLLVDVSRHVTGLAVEELARPDVAFALRAPHALSSGWLGDNIGGLPVAAYGLIDNGAAACELVPA